MKKRKLQVMVSCIVMASLLSSCGMVKSDSQSSCESVDINYPASSESACEESGYYEGYDYWEENEEEYGEIKEQGFMNVKGSPLSTFSADVDTASYANIRRMLKEGYELEDIPEDAVRVEEMLNYFTYDYQRPQGKEPFGVTMEMGDCPWNMENKLLRIGLCTKEVDFSETPDSNLVFLIDVSGSMYDDDKLPLLQEAFSMLTENLTEKDCVSIVTYAGSDSVVIEGVSGDKKKKILRAIDSLEAGGSTAGSAGIMTAYEIASEYYIEGGNNRVILATDGDLNVGLTTEKELEDLITEEKESGVYLSVLGFGTGNLKDNKMEILADKGNGNYGYIDSEREARKILVDEMGATLVTVAKDVKFQLEFDSEVVEGYRLIGYENRALENKDFDDDTKDAGEVGAGHSVTVLYELILTKNHKDLADCAILNIRYKEPEENQSELLTYPVSLKVYEDIPSDDWLFAAAVAQFGQILRGSEYKGDATLKGVRDLLDEVEDKNYYDKDEYKQEFYEMVDNEIR